MYVNVMSEQIIVNEENQELLTAVLNALLSIQIKTFL